MTNENNLHGTRFYAGMNKKVLCFERATGEIVWETELPDTWGGTMNILLDGNRIYAATHKQVACVKTESGEIVWRTELKKLTTPVSMALDKSVPGGQLILSCSGLLFALWAETGEVFWKNGLKGYGYHYICMRVPGALVAQPSLRVVTQGKTTVTQVVGDDQIQG